MERAAYGAQCSDRVQVMKVRILIDRGRIEASRAAKKNLSPICIFPFDQQVAPRYIKGFRGRGSFELLPEFDGSNKLGYDGHVSLVCELEDLEIEE